VVLGHAHILTFPPSLPPFPPLQCDTALAYWNLFLALFSIMGALRIVPHLLWFSATHTFKETVCTPPQMMNGDGASGLWCLLFTLSKVIELLDTMFVCLKGRTPIFLHWYVVEKEEGEMRGGREGGMGRGVVWCLLFTLSKVIELLDTMFVCLKGRTPIFWHW